MTRKQKWTAQDMWARTGMTIFLFSNWWTSHRLVITTTVPYVAVWSRSHYFRMRKIRNVSRTADSMFYYHCCTVNCGCVYSPYATTRHVYSRCDVKQTQTFSFVNATWDGNTAEVISGYSRTYVAHALLRGSRGKPQPFVLQKRNNDRTAIKVHI